MKFTAQQYDNAIEALQDAKKQLEADGNHCSICSDSGHMAFECGHNPLLAMAICDASANLGKEIHDRLHTQDNDETDPDGVHDAMHWLAGYDIQFGVQRGPRCIVVPSSESKSGE